MTKLETLRQAINDRYRMDETTAIRELRSQYPQGLHQHAYAKAAEWIDAYKKDAACTSPFSTANLLNHYKLSEPEGLALMCLAETLQRVPDGATIDLLIQDQLGKGSWKNKRTSHPLFKGLNAGIKLAKTLGKQWPTHWIVRQSVIQALKFVGDYFILGTTTEKAIRRARKDMDRGYTHAFDMLGEAALTQADAQRYFLAYKQALLDLTNLPNHQTIIKNPNLSVKLSALDPCYTYTHRDQTLKNLYPLLLELCTLCKDFNLSLTIDAEESDRLDLSLDLIEQLRKAPELSGWKGLGFAVQAYQKRAPAVIDWACALANETGEGLHIRLVKGAYWDSEIKHAQELGLKGYPVYTRKAATDLSYLVCAHKLLTACDLIYPKFATHNAYTIAAIRHMARDRAEPYEFQRLHGMGVELYDLIRTHENDSFPCRIYAPVGSYKDLLPYLVRRLLENGANTSFVNQLSDPTYDTQTLIEDPMQTLENHKNTPHPRIPHPRHMFPNGRLHALSIDLSNRDDVAPLLQAVKSYKPLTAYPVVNGQKMTDTPHHPVTSPQDHTRVVGQYHAATPAHVDAAFESAWAFFETWEATPAETRAQILEKTADLMEVHFYDLMALITLEGGKTHKDSQADLREGIDFCRYYAERARIDFANPEVLPGPTGEYDEIRLRGRGVFVCISPWNFPLAIFLGQVTGALAAGDCVLAKPSELTPLVAYRCVELLYEAGLPKAALHFLPGSAKDIGDALLEHPHLGGVALTGSVATAKVLQRKLADRPGPVLPLIAETGGQNVMFVDSSALPEQVVQDVIISAFQSAGQRCSALRVLLLQNEIADKVIEMLKGAMASLTIGDPANLETDIGPVIEQKAKDALNAYCTDMKSKAKVIYELPLPQGLNQGTFVSPIAFEIQSLSDLSGEQFGPILHILRYDINTLDTMIDQVNGLGFGLTLGIHSRSESRIKHITSRMRVGNMYVNRTMIGAVVGVQPFGGEGLSGTGPKAGGPRYMHRFATERTLCINTTAQGGNTSLMTMDDK